MVRELYENAKRGIDTRQNLSALRSAIKDDALMNDLFELVEDDIESMKSFLDSDDAKVRKNATLFSQFFEKLRKFSFRSSFLPYYIFRLLLLFYLPEFF